MSQQWTRKLERYKRLGHDRYASLDAILNVSEPLVSPTLDVGTGRGMLAEALAKRGVEVVSVDVDEAKIREARERMGDVARLVRFVLGDAANMPLQDKQVPLAISVNAIHHLDSFEPVARELGRVVKATGRVVLVDFTEEGFRILDEAFAEEGQKHSTTGLTLNQAVEAMEALGWRILRRAQRHQQDIVVLQRGAQR